MLSCIMLKNGLTCVKTASFLKYAWPLFNTIHENINLLSAFQYLDRIRLSPLSGLVRKNFRYFYKDIVNILSISSANATAVLSSGIITGQIGCPSP